MKSNLPLLTIAVIAIACFQISTPLSTHAQSSSYYHRWGNTPAEFNQLKSRIQQQIDSNQQRLANPFQNNWQMGQAGYPSPQTLDFRTHTQWNMQPFRFSGMNQGRFSATFQSVPLGQVIAQLAQPLVTENETLFIDQRWVLEPLLSEPIDFFSDRNSPREALEDLLKSIDLCLHPTVEGYIITLKADAATVERRSKDSPADFVSLNRIALEQILNAPIPLTMHQVPLGMFLQFAQARMQNQIEIDSTAAGQMMGKLVDTGFSATTFGASLRSGLQSVDLDYQIEQGKLKITKKDDGSR